MDIYSVLKPSLYLSKLLGLAPYGLEGEIGNRCYVLQRENMVFSLVLVLLLGVCDAYSLSTAHEKNNSFSTTVTQIQLQAEFGLASLVILMSLYQAKKSMKFYKEVDDLDKKLKLCSIDISYSFIQKFSLTQTTVGCIGFLGAIPLAYFVTVSVPLSSIVAWFFYWVMYLVPKLINFCFASNFVDGVMLLKHRFKLINSQLEEMGGSEKDTMSFPLRSGLIHVKPIRKMSMMSRFDQIQNMHYTLCDLVKDINGIYAVQILLFIALIFTSVTIGLNTCFISITARQTGKEENPSEIPYSILCMYALFFAALQITVIALGCAYTSAEANKTATLVHKLLIDFTDEAVKSELELFSLQLLHRKVQLTACGFFPIDATLLYSIVGGVTTYLVILIQFQLAPAPTSTDPTANNTLGNATKMPVANLTTPAFNLTALTANLSGKAVNITTP